jgi:enamine deaminase RidA (YjgF/YER057c/UK114 family)
MTSTVAVGCLAGILLGVFAAPGLAQESAPEDPHGGNVQIIRSPRETVIVISGVTPLDGQSGSLAAGDLLGQMKQALENLRRTAIRSGVLPSQVVTITVFTPEAARADELRQLVSDSYRDWHPLIAIEPRPLTMPKALIEIEAVAIAREAKPR